MITQDKKEAAEKQLKEIELKRQFLNAKIGKTNVASEIESALDPAFVSAANAMDEATLKS